jgi:uncharacterized protein (DUF2384 family)
MAEDVLGSPEKASRWLRAPNLALRRQVPLALLDTDSGAHEVEGILIRIASGTYS